MSIPKVAGIETEYAVMIVGVDESDPFLASQLILDAYQRVGMSAVPCQPYTLMHSTSSRQEEIIVPGEDVHSTSPRWERAAHYARRGQSAAMSDVMLTNGARLYIDHAHPEYSTPECLSPRLLVAADKAGERILASCQHWLNVIEVLPRGQSVRLYKNNSDYKDNSYGCHENYLLSADLFNNLLHRKTQIFRYLFPFFVTRGILCGSGKIGSENGTAPTGFQLSQRADFFEALIGLQTTHERPLFNTRDEAHADAARFRRLHVILGDANMAEFSTYLKVGMTQLVLQMLEDDFIRTDLTLADPLSAMLTVSRDLTFQQALSMEDGSSMTALDIQYIFLELAHRYLTEKGGSEEQWDILEIWNDGLNMLPEQWQSLSTRFDWAIKKRVFDRYLLTQGATWEEVASWQRIIEMPGTNGAAKTSAEQAGLAWSDYEKQRELYFALRRLNLEYHDIRHNADLGGEVGLFYRLQRLGAVERLVTEEEIQERVTLPSPDTRSWLRGQCIARFPDALVSADWSGLHFRLSGQDSYLDLPDPLLDTEAALAPMWEQLDKPSNLIEYLTSGGVVR